MRNIVRIASLLTFAAFAMACDGDDEPTPPGAGPFDLTFEGDATFQTPHGDQLLYAAVVRSSNGTVVARDTATISDSEDPSFSFTFANVLQAGTSYRIHYWIDSNFMDGTVGVCGPPADDHQWNIEVPVASADVTVTETHDASATMDVCATFAADLTFAGDATFQTPHGDQDIYVAVVRDGAVLATDQGVVSTSADPSFSFDFPGVLVIGIAYEVHYWIDSNFNGGTVGTCDPPVNDHQWNIPVPAVTADVIHTETHDASATEEVCSSFP